MSDPTPVTTAKPTTTFSIEVPNDQVELIADAFVSAFADYTLEDGQEDTTELRLAFARTKIIDYIQTVVRTDQLQKAHLAATADVPDEPLNIT